MNKCTAMMASFLLCGMSLLSQAAEVKVVKKKNLPPLDPMFETRIEQAVMKSHGGRIRRPGTGTGKLLIVNNQKKVANEVFKKLASKLTDELRIDVEVVNATNSINIVSASRVVFDNAAAVAVIVADTTEQPSMLIAPEERWSMVNVSKMGNNAEIQAQGEVVRALAFVSGCGINPTTQSLTGMLNGPSDVERFKRFRLGGDAVRKMQAYLKNLGVEPFAVTFYDKACQEGWAPKPANEWQEAIWKKVHSKPDKPLQIKYDPARDKGK